VVFPWYYFGGGMKLSAGGVGHRFSFLRPQNTQDLPGVADIPAGRAAGGPGRSCSPAPAPVGEPPVSF
jgi:hypothetical protein